MLEGRNVDRQAISDILHRYDDSVPGIREAKRLLDEMLPGEFFSQEKQFLLIKCFAEQYPYRRHDRPSCKQRHVVVEIMGEILSLPKEPSLKKHSSWDKSKDHEYRKMLHQEDKKGLKTLAKAFALLHKAKLFTQENFQALINHQKRYEVAVAIADLGKDVLKQYVKEVLTQEVFQGLLFKEKNHNGVVAALQSLINAKLFIHSNVTRLLFSPESECLFTDEGSYIWSQIPDNLLTQQVLDDIFIRAKRNNPQQEIQAYLASLQDYASKRQAIAEIDEASNRNRSHKWEIYGKLIGFPRYVVAELLKEAFSWTLGFKWLLYLLERLELPYKKITLPTFSVTSDFNPSRMAGLYGNEVNDAYAGHVVPGTIEYPLTALNFLFVGFNYLARNLGKALGILILLPWTVPTTLINRGIHAAKSIYYSHKIKKKMSELSADEGKSNLVRDYLQHRLTLDAQKLLDNVNADEISAGIEDYIISYAESVRKNVWSSPGRFAKVHQLGKLKEAIEERGKEAKKHGIAGIIVAAILLTPLSLFVSIPLFVRSMRKNKQLESGFEIGIANVESIDENLEALADRKKSAFEIGMGYLSQDVIDQRNAYRFLSLVPPDDENYPKAMHECGNICLAHNYYEDAQVFFEKAEDIGEGLSRVASRLAAGQEVSVQDAFRQDDQTNKGKEEKAGAGSSMESSASSEKPCDYGSQGKYSPQMHKPAGQQGFPIGNDNNKPSSRLADAPPADAAARR